MDRREELATAALATLNNITFYLEPTENLDPLDDHIEQLCKGNSRNAVSVLFIVNKRDATMDLSVSQL